MEIRPIRIDDPAEFGRYYAITASAEQAGRETAPIFTEAELRAMMDGSVDAEVVEGYGGFVAGEMVVAGLSFYSRTDNVDLAEVWAGVEPDRRGRGHGGAMVGDLLERNLAAGRTRVLARSWIPFGRLDDHPHRRFAERHGFAVANVEIRRELRLPVDAAALDGWERDAAPHHTGYRLESVRGDVPDALVPSLCALMNQLGVDAPTGDIELEARRLDPAAFRSREERSKAAGKVMVRTLALDDAGEVVAFTTFAVPTKEPAVVYQYGTLVRSDHRGHRLGLAVKVANLRRLQQDFPDRAYVETLNAEQNGPMVDINDVLGFRPVEILAHYQRTMR